MVPLKNNSTMDKETFQKMIFITEKLIEEGVYDNVHFRLSGGEPLINFQVYKDIITKVRRKCPTTIKFGILTNGVLITDEILDWMQLNGIGAQVSLDDLINSKPLKDGSSSSLKTVENLLKIKRRGMEKSISINTVLDVDKTESLIPLVNFICKEFPNNTWGLNASYTEGDSTKTEKILKIFKEGISYLKEKGFDIKNNLRFYNMVVGQSQGGCCAGTDSMFSIGTNLEVWACQSLLDKEPLGPYDENIISTLQNPANEKFYNQEIYKNCAWCPIIEFCKGGCRVVYSNPDIMDNTCKIKREIIEFILDETTGYVPLSQRMNMENRDVLNIGTIIDDYVLTSANKESATPEGSLSVKDE
jgi:radical SAM protein with 4Fe4S-binding SPASM domain